jgi:hypothetical protein
VHLRLFASAAWRLARDRLAGDELALGDAVGDDAVGRAEGLEAIHPGLDGQDVLYEVIYAPLAPLGAHPLEEGFVSGCGLRAELGVLFVPFELDSIAEARDLDAGETLLDLIEALNCPLAGGQPWF